MADDPPMNREGLEPVMLGMPLWDGCHDSQGRPGRSLGRLGVASEEAYENRACPISMGRCVTAPNDNPRLTRQPEVAGILSTH